MKVMILVQKNDSLLVIHFLADNIISIALNSQTKMMIR